MKYLELVIHTTKEGLEPVEACLMEMGFTDMVVNDPGDLQDLMNKKHDYDWDYIGDEVLKMADEEPTVTMYFDGEETGNGRIGKNPSGGVGQIPGKVVKHAACPVQK